MSSLLGHIPWESNILGESVQMFEKHQSVGFLVVVLNYGTAQL